MSSAEWKLDEDSELNVLIPWLDEQQDPEIRARVLECIANLLLDPNLPALEDEPNVFSIEVPKASVVIVWHLNRERRAILVSHIGAS